MHHERVEAWILAQDGIAFLAEAEAKPSKLVRVQ